METKLRNSDRRFGEIFDNSLAVMLLIDPETHRIIAANNAAENYYGWSKLQLEKMLISDINTLSPAEIKVENEKARLSERIYYRVKHRLASGEVHNVDVYNGKVEIDGKEYLHSIIHDVTEQAIAEESLKNNERILSLFVEHSPASIAMFDTEMRYLVYSRRYLTDYDLDKRNITGLSHYEVFPEIPQRWKEMHQRCLKGEILSADNDPFPRANGKLDWIRWDIHPWFKNDNEVGGIILFSEVMTERKNSIEAIREGEAYNRMLFEQSQIGLALADMDGKLVDINPAFAAIMGRTIEEVKSLSYWDITPGKYASQEQEQLEFLEKRGSYGPYEKEYLHKDGHLVPVRLQGLIIEREGKKYIWSSAENISEQKKTIEKQINSLNLLNNLALQVPGVVYQYRLYPDGRSSFPYSSPGMWDIYEVTPEEVREDASKVFTRIHPDDYDYIANTITESSKNQTNYESEFRVILPKQGLRWRHSNAKPERMEDGSTLWHGIITDITERKLAEVAMQKSEEQYRTLFETMTQGVVYQNSRGEIISANPAAEKILGLSISQMKGRKSIDARWKAVDENKNLLPGEKHPAMMALRTGKKVKNFTQGIFNPKKNEYVWILVDSIPQYNEGEKKPYQVFSTFLDITERKKAEEALSHSHELMKYIIEHNKSAVAVHDRELNYLFVSRRYLEDYGIKEKNVIGKHHYDVFPDLPQKWRKVHQKALKGIVSQADEDIFYREDGTIDWTRWECRPWYEANGSIGGIVVYTEVINDQKRKEEEIIKLNQRLKILIESIQQLSSSQSLNSVQEIVTNSARKLIGADGATFVLRENNYCFYVNEDAIQPLWKGKKFPINSCISGWVMENKKAVVIEDIFSDERILKDVYNPTFVKSLAMVPINSIDPIGAIGNYWKEAYTPTETELQLLQTLANAAGRAIESINLYAELEERVRQRTEQLHAANKELETFTYSVSHDLKAPLRGIDGYSKLLLDEYGSSLNEEAVHFIKTIRSSTLHMNLLIEDLLSYSRLERIHFKKEEIALKSFMDALVSSFDEEIKKDGFQVKMNIPEVKIVADSTGLSIALRNILENAIKFTRQVPEPKIEIDLYQKPDSWIIAVKDNGVGFDMKYHDRIFDIFQRLHRPEDFPGTGVGLAMVAKALQRMKGKAWAESTPGEGSTFCIEIPKTNV